MRTNTDTSEYILETAQHVEELNERFADRFTADEQANLDQTVDSLRRLAAVVQNAERGRPSPTRTLGITA